MVGRFACKSSSGIFSLGMQKHSQKCQAVIALCFIGQNPDGEDIWEGLCLHGLAITISKISIPFLKEVGEVDIGIAKRNSCIPGIAMSILYCSKFLNGVVFEKVMTFVRCLWHWYARNLERRRFSGKVAKSC